MGLIFGDSQKKESPEGGSHPGLKLTVRKDTDMSNSTLDGTAKESTARDLAWLSLCIDKSKKGVFMESVQLTPSLAAALLSINEDNRSLREHKSMLYAKDMIAGRWQINGETIAISKCGFLNDGQHRCDAVRRSGVTVPALLVFGLDRESRKTTDQGAVKTAGDYLGMDGFENPKALAGIANALIQIETLNRLNAGTSERPTRGEILERVASDPLIAESYRHVKRSGASKVAEPRLLGALHYLFKRKSQDQADQFMELLISGVGLESKSPVYIAREKLMNRLHRLTVSEKAKTLIAAWNNFREGKQVRSLKHAMSSGEKLPEIK